MWQLAPTCHPKKTPVQPLTSDSHSYYSYCWQRKNALLTQNLLVTEIKTLRQLAWCPLYSDKEKSWSSFVRLTCCTEGLLSVYFQYHVTFFSAFWFKNSMTQASGRSRRKWLNATRLIRKAFRSHTVSGVCVNPTNTYYHQQISLW